MALSIKDEKADRLARELARRTGESLTKAVTRAVELRLWRLNCHARYGAARSHDEITARVAESLSRLRRTLGGVEEG